MIDRYKTEEMNVIWNEEAKIKRWVQIEAIVASVMYDCGEIPDEEFTKMVTAELPTIERINELEKETDHDVVAFVRAYGENMGSAARFLHKGLTSSDIVDTATSIAIRDSIEIIINSMCELGEVLKEKALKYKDLPCIGRTHGIHAEPTSFGLKFLSWYAESLRNSDRLAFQWGNMSFGKLSGAVGNYSQHDWDFEHKVLNKLHLESEDVATQIIPRDRHAEVVSCLALVGVMIERIATEIRSLQRTEIREVEEKFKIGQTGSSAMPHKHNPILSERLCGISRLLRSYMITAFENVALWHERDISHSSNERIIFPDMFHLTHYMIIKTKSLIETLTVFEDQIKKNIDRTHGLIYSQNILSFLISNKFDRTEAYKIIQNAAQEMMDGRDSISDFTWVIFENIKKTFPDFEMNRDFRDQLISLTNSTIYLKNVNKIYEVLGVI